VKVVGVFVRFRAPASASAGHLPSAHRTRVRSNAWMPLKRVAPRPLRHPAYEGLSSAEVLASAAAAARLGRCSVLVGAVHHSAV
jgi:hypothetical protein